MKNIFKIFGIAVLACGMMVACNKPENETPDNPGGGGNQQQEETPVFTIKWDNADQTIGFKNIAYNNGYLQGASVYMVEAAQGLSGEEYEFPAFITYYIYSDSENYGLSAQYKLTVNGEQVSANDYFPNEVYEAGGITYNDDVYGDYQIYGLNAEPTMTVDATALKLSVAVDLKFYSLEDYLGGIPQDQLTTKDMVMNVENYTFAEGEFLK